jgi:signal transduction histidine kinase
MVIQTPLLRRSIDCPVSSVSTHTPASYIPVHLEYILTEILKNAFRATVEAHYRLHGTVSGEPIPPINITISPASVPDHSHRTFLSLRVRDQGGGVAPAHISRIFSYAFTTAGHADNSGACDGNGDTHTSQQVPAGGIGGGNLFENITGQGLRAGIGTIAGLGYGLPMSKLYAKYFGGSLELIPLDGWGEINQKYSAVN